MRSLFSLPLALIAGCYSYQSVGQVDTASPEPGKRVELRLTDEGGRALVSQLGPDAQTVDADVVGSDTSAIMLAVWHVEDTHNRQTQWRGERVVIPRGAIATLRERKLSVAGTGVLGGLIAGGALVAYEAFKGGGELEGNGPTSGPGQGQQ
ncbi:MAG TPA: hypothetical protein VN719_02590 [Gemmatimonadales bacterium]|jgi:hypothetical protein|nr:hypothetical protein [Gemmatimonadales bacterium]